MGLYIRAGDNAELAPPCYAVGDANAFADKKLHIIQAGGGEQVCLFDRRSSNSRRTAGSRVHLHHGGEEWLAANQRYNLFAGESYDASSTFPQLLRQVAGCEIATDTQYVWPSLDRSWSVTGLRPESLWNAGYLFITDNGSFGPLADNNFAFNCIYANWNKPYTPASVARLYVDGVLVVEKAGVYSTGLYYICKMTKPDFTVRVVLANPPEPWNPIFCLSGIRKVS